MSNHGYLKPGQWIQLTISIEIDSSIDLSRVNINRGTYIRYEGGIGSKMIFSYGPHRFNTTRSGIKFNTISPKNSSNLEILYGQK